MKRFVPLAGILLALDAGLIVVSGGWSVLGESSGLGLFVRLTLLGALAALRWWPKPELGLLLLSLVLVQLLHHYGYRLRGDALWMYAFARSLAIEGDVSLENDYRRLGLEEFSGSQIVPETGRARYTYPIGASLVWLPFIEVGHIGALLRNLHGETTAYDGFADPYLHSTALGSLLCGMAGLLLLFRFLGRWFEASTALLATLGIGGGSFLLWYLAYQPIYSHAPTFLVVTLILERWVRLDETEPRARDYALLGVLVGVAYLIRWQNALFGLLPAYSLSRSALRDRSISRETLRFAAGLGGGFVALMLLQLVTWKLIFGSFWIGVPLGEDYMLWSRPFLSEILFSSRHGLFSWSPLLLFALPGLVVFGWRHPHPSLPLLGMLLLLTYVNSAVADWWGGGSFGARRFDSTLPILALGLATTIAWAQRFVRARPGVVVAAVLAAFGLSNWLLMEQVRKGRLPADDTHSWELALRGMSEDVFDSVGYPFSAPANWVFSVTYDRPLTQYDLLVGKYLFHRQNNLGGIIEIGSSDPPFIGNGWSGVKAWKESGEEVRYAERPPAGVFVPLAVPRKLELYIEAARPSDAPSGRLEIRLNGERVGGFLPSAELTEFRFTLDRGRSRRLNLLEFLPAGSTSDGSPFLVLNRLRFVEIE